MIVQTVSHISVRNESFCKKIEMIERVLKVFVLVLLKELTILRESRTNF